MSEANNRTPDARRKRVQKLKKLIILILITVISIPCICCVILFARVRILSESVAELTGEIEMLQELVEELQRSTDAMSTTDVSGMGSVPDNKAETEELYSAVVEQQDGQEAEEALQDDRRRVYLTFDDGPGIYTDDILDILEQYEVKATFFVVGKEDETSKTAMQEIVRRGHSLGMHSYSHKYKEIYASVDNFAEDFVKLREYLYEVTGVWSNIYRFPGGSSNKVSEMDMREFATYLEEQNVVFYDWNVSSGDGGSVLLSVEQLLENCIDGVESRKDAVILLHDSADKKTTVEALPFIIENILAMEDTVILPITEETKPVQHISK